MEGSISLVISDYDKGVVIVKAHALIDEANRHGIPVIMDPKLTASIGAQLNNSDIREEGLDLLRRRMGHDATSATEALMNEHGWGQVGSRRQCWSDALPFRWPKCFHLRQ